MDTQYEELKAAWLAAYVAEFQRLAPEIDTATATAAATATAETEEEEHGPLVARWEAAEEAAREELSLWVDDEGADNG